MLRSYHASCSNQAGPPRRSLLAAAGAFGLAACHPLRQSAAQPDASFAGPAIVREAFVSSDGARLPLQTWVATDPARQPVEPWAVIVGLHGMNDYAQAFGLPGAYWASRGVTTYAYDQRGFGRSAQRGVWAGAERMAEDLRTLCALVRARHPRAVLGVVGESMGGAVAIAAFASPDPPTADRLVLASPAVWGWRDQGPANSAALWATAHLAPGYRLTAPDWIAKRIRATDNTDELRRMGRDPQMIFATRVDTVYGLVGLMQRAQDDIGRVRAPTLYLYGAHDDLIPKPAAFRAARRLNDQARSAYYAAGWHLLLRDLARARVLDDVLAFLRDPAAPLPSGAGPILAGERG